MQFYPAETPDRTARFLNIVKSCAEEYNGADGGPLIFLRKKETACLENLR